MSFWSGLIGSVVAGGTNLLGSVLGNKANKDAAADQMRFQEEMSGTSYQRAVADMKAADLNPMLAYGQGGASTPSGATYSAQNAGASALEGALSAMNSFSSSAKNLADAASTEAGMPLTKMKNQVPDLINQGVDKLKSMLNWSADSDKISVSDLPSYGASPSSAEAAGIPATGASETADADLLTQLFYPDGVPDGADSWSPAHRAIERLGKANPLGHLVDKIGQWNPYGF